MLISIISLICLSYLFMAFTCSLIIDIQKQIHLFVVIFREVAIRLEDAGAE